MFIISKKALRFVLRDKNKVVVDTREVRPGVMTTLPDWVKNDELFKLAEKEGCITFVEQQKVVNIPNPGGNKEPEKTSCELCGSVTAELDDGKGLSCSNPECASKTPNPDGDNQLTSDNEPPKEDELPKTERGKTRG